MDTSAQTEGFTTSRVGNDRPTQDRYAQAFDSSGFTDSPVGAGWQSGAPTGGFSAAPSYSDTPQSEAVLHRETPPRQTANQRYVEGEVRGLQQRQGRAGIQEILAFRIEQYDQQGNRLAPIPVELHGNYRRGLLHEGDVVRVQCKKNAQLPLRPKVIFNLTTGSKVSSSKPPSNVRIHNSIGLFFKLLFLAPFLVLVAAAVYWMIRSAL